MTFSGCGLCGLVGCCRGVAGCVRRAGVGCVVVTVLEAVDVRRWVSSRLSV